jgi:Pyruvate/2-oxoacid:ferredoxin oxidoreductase delta subunit
LNYDSWQLRNTATSLWQEANDAIELAKLGNAQKTDETNEEEQGTPFEESTSIIEVLNQKPEKTKTNRVLQIIQEQTDELHEISVKCRDCQFFNPEGKSYAERCMSPNTSFHNFRRFTVEGKEAFNCYNYTPKREIIERKKKEANVDMAVALFELMIYHNGYGKEYPDLSWAKNQIPELRDKNYSVQEVVEKFAAQDEQTRAYWVEAFYRRLQLNEVVSKNKPHPFYTAEGSRFIVDYKSMENDDQI